MGLSKWFGCVTYLLFLMSWAQPVAGSPEKHALVQRLLGNYSVHVRPVLREETIIQVNVTLVPLFILGLDMKAQTFQTSGFLDVVWRDEYLVWDPRDYANITDILLSQSNVWLPDLALINDVRGPGFFGGDRTQIQLGHDGMITWQPEFQATTGCKADIYKYPFDQQECTVKFMPWMLTTKYMLVAYPACDLDSAERTSGELHVTHARTETNIFPVTYSESHLLEGHFIIGLKRQYNSYLLSTIIPLVAFSLLSPLALLVPADSGEKITLSVTVLLANVVFMGSLSDSIPRVADSTSVFVVYSSLQVILSFVNVIVNVGVVYLSYPSDSDSRGDDEDTDTSQDPPGSDHHAAQTELRPHYNPYSHPRPGLLSKSFQRLYRFVTPSPTDFSARRHSFRRRTQHQRLQRAVSTIQSLKDDFRFTDETPDQKTMEEKAFCQEEDALRARSSAAIGRRDRICFITMFLIVVCVNVVTFVILVL